MKEWSVVGGLSLVVDTTAVPPATYQMSATSYVGAPWCGK
jgi:hypothetical protein